MKQVKKISKKVLFIFMSILIATSLISCTNKSKQQDIISISETEVANIYKNVKIGDNIKSIENKLGKATAITPSDVKDSKGKYIWMAIDYGNKYIEFDVDKDGNILNKRTELDIK